MVDSNLRNSVPQGQNKDSLFYWNFLNLVYNTTYDYPTYIDNKIFHSGIHQNNLYFTSEFTILSRLRVCAFGNRGVNYWNESSL